MSDKEDYFPLHTDINAINDTLYTDYQIKNEEIDNDKNKDFIDYFDEPPF